MRKKKEDIKIQPLQRQLFNKEASAKALEAGSKEVGMPRMWEELGTDESGKPTYACFWGLTYDEGLLSRRLGSKVKLQNVGNEYKPELEPDPDKLPLVYLMMGARAGDGPEFAFDPISGKARTIFEYPQDVDLVKKLIPTGRINILADLVDQLSVISLSQLIGHYRFFGHVMLLASGFRNSLLPSLIELLKNSSTEEVQKRLESMGEDLKDIEDSAGTLLAGSSFLGSKLN